MDDKQKIKQKENWRQKASILRPPGYEPGALPVAPCRLMGYKALIQLIPMLFRKLDP